MSLAAGTGVEALEQDVTCAICGYLSRQFAPVRVPEDAPPDFDTRPGPPWSTALDTWIAQCPHCGYCAEDLSTAATDAAEVVHSAEYAERLASDTGSWLARRFACYALIVERAHHWADAGWVWLHAAWASDDAGDEDVAVECRRLAIDRWKRAKELGEGFADDLATEFAIVTDLYRRMGEFENATVTCAEALDVEDIPAPIEQMLRRQMTLIQRRDTSRHSMAELYSREDDRQAEESRPEEADPAGG
jgi:hypothetical protein